MEAVYQPKQVSVDLSDGQQRVELKALGKFARVFVNLTWSDVQAEEGDELDGTVIMQVRSSAAMGWVDIEELTSNIDIEASSDGFLHYHFGAGEACLLITPNSITSGTLQIEMIAKA